MDQGSTPLNNVVPETARGTSTLVPAITPVNRRGRGVAARDYLGSMLFVGPYLLFFLAFTVVPLFWALWVSLHNWNTTGGNAGWAALAHYKNLFVGYNTFDVVQAYWQAMENTVLFSIISVPLLVLVALIFALLLASGPLRNGFRAIFYVPSVLSVAVAMTVWLWIFNSNGMANTYLHRSIPWLIQQPYAWLTIFIATLWWTPGFNMVILLAGIMEVPNDYHEAARIDGANGLQRIWYITLPILRPVLAFVVITQMIASFGLFGQPFILTKGGPSTIGGPTHSTMPVALQIYNEAFGTDQNLALAASESFILGLILIILAVMQLRFFRATEM
jgi:multiple sugar transport system permease protein